MGDQQGEKKSKTCSGIHCHSIAVLDYVFPATSKNLRVAVPVKTQVCIAHSAVSNYNHKQMSKGVEGESKCVWCSPPACFPCFASWFRQYSLFSSPHHVSLAGTLCDTRQCQGSDNRSPCVRGGVLWQPRVVCIVILNQHQVSSCPLLLLFLRMRNICTCEGGFEVLGIFGGRRTADQLLGQEATLSLQAQHTHSRFL